MLLQDNRDAQIGAKAVNISTPPGWLEPMASAPEHIMPPQYVHHILCCLIHTPSLAWITDASSCSMRRKKGASSGPSARLMIPTSFSRPIPSGLDGLSATCLMIPISLFRPRPSGQDGFSATRLMIPVSSYKPTFRPGWLLCNQPVPAWKLRVLKENLRRDERKHKSRACARKSAA